MADHGRPALLASARDIRLDLFRGLALWFIFLDHIPTNVMSWLTVRNYGFSDATEIFVFISGYTAVIAYARMMEREGWLRAAARIYRRVWQLYVAHILLFVAFSAQIAWVSIAHDTPALIEEMQLLGLGQNPYQAILEAALLKFRPVNLDVLPLYIVLLAAFPFVLPAVVRWPLAVIAASLALYAATCHYNWNLPAYPDEKVWYFNPMAWQVVFYGGAACAVLGPQLAWLDRFRLAADRPCRPLSPVCRLYRPVLALQSAGAAGTGLGRPADLPDRQDQHRYPAVYALPGGRLAGPAACPVQFGLPHVADFRATSQMRRAVVAYILPGHLSCVVRTGDRQSIRRVAPVADFGERRRHRRHVRGRLCRGLVQERGTGWTEKDVDSAGAVP